MSVDDFFTAAMQKVTGGGMPRLGKVCGMDGQLVRAVLPEPSMGQWVVLSSADNQIHLEAQVVAFDQENIWLCPVGSVNGIGPGWSVRPSEPLAVVVSGSIRGRILDGLGRPMDGKGPLTGEPRPFEQDAPDPLSRPMVHLPLVTGVRVIDGLCTLARGQRVGLFAGSGVGKSHLLGQLARQATSDITVVCLVGERGREVVEFIRDNLTEKGLQNCVMVVATSDQPALVRAMAPHCATAVAEYFRDSGMDVLLLVDSLTRLARARREIHLQLGEAPARRGYPPSVFACLPGLLERAGPSMHGSITALYTVLVEGSDMDEPVADEVRGLLDGHLVLTRELAELGHYPALDVSRSVSRLANRVIAGEQRDLAKRLRTWISAHRSVRDLLRIGAYQAGSDPVVDEALPHMEELAAFCRQDFGTSTWEDTWNWMQRIVPS